MTRKKLYSSDIKNYSVLIPALEVCGRSRTKVISLCLRRPYFVFVVNFSFKKIHVHATSALINFCEGVERDALLPYLDPIVERLLK